ncbi:helix-turn-helix transcriptional regulator [Kitasatospora sp. NPDC088391]|uniref:helix-turn-helix transcriptional regulator n=1 Tax=Kitasatospora sp. NPDC088391 TaxID=3364074 RepID=UPI0038221611
MSAAASSPSGGRTVHPELTGAVLHALPPSGAEPSPVVLARRLLAAGGPVPEQVHRELLALLHRHGWPTVRAAGERLFSRPRDPLLRSLVAAADVPDLLARARLAEPWLYIGHTTREVLRPGELTVRHLGHLGHRPRPAESLFVCAIHLAAVTAVTGRTPDVRLLTADGRALPPTGSAAPPLTGWRLRWDAPPPGPAPVRPLVGELRARIALDPTAPWRLARAATELGLSPRTLQRALTAAGTTFQAELTRVRVATAGHLLRRTDLPVHEIAAAAGFTDHPHLTRTFRTHHGRTPTAFRHLPAEEAAAEAEEGGRVRRS